MLQGRVRLKETSAKSQKLDSRTRERDARSFFHRPSRQIAEAEDRPAILPTDITETKAAKDSEGSRKGCFSSCSGAPKNIILHEFQSTMEAPKSELIKCDIYRAYINLEKVFGD